MDIEENEKEFGKFKNFMSKVFHREEEADTEEELLKLMQDLADIDLKIKTTDSDPNNLLELFILNI